jgi:hypothetical protein
MVLFPLLYFVVSNSKQVAAANMGLVHNYRGVLVAVGTGNLILRFRDLGRTNKQSGTIYFQSDCDFLLCRFPEHESNGKPLGVGV